MVDYAERIAPVHARQADQKVELHPGIVSEFQRRARNSEAGTVTVSGSLSENSADGTLDANISLTLFMGCIIVCGYFFLLSVHAAEEMLGFHLALQLHHAVEQSLRTRGATRHVHVDGNNLLDPLQHMVRLFERPCRKAQAPIAITYFGSAI